MRSRYYHLSFEKETNKSQNAFPKLKENETLFGVKLKKKYLYPVSIYYPQENFKVKKFNVEYYYLEQEKKYWNRKQVTTGTTSVSNTLLFFIYIIIQQEK